jgi:hypothetical protein
MHGHLRETGCHESDKVSDIRMRDRKAVNFSCGREAVNALGNRKAVNRTLGAGRRPGLDGRQRGKLGAGPEDRREQLRRTSGRGPQARLLRRGGQWPRPRAPLPPQRRSRQRGRKSAHRRPARARAASALGFPRGLARFIPKANDERPDRIGALAVFLFHGRPQSGRFRGCRCQFLGAQAEAISSGEKAAGTSLKQA